MFDNNWRTWVVVVVAFVGASFELLKHMPIRESVAWDKENLHYGTDGKPYSVHDIPADSARRRRKHSVHVAGDQKILEAELKKYVAATTPAQTEVPHVGAPAAAAAAAAAKDKKKKKNDDEYEEVIDPVTGKKVRRKKKKDAKKDEKPAAAVAAASTDIPPAKNDDDSSAAAINAAIAETANTGAFTPPIKQSSNPFASLQEWERLLLARPDLAETKIFIQDYKNHMVSSDIYYKITKLMIADSRAEMKSLGLLCAGSAPSVVSFGVLAGVARSGTADLKQQAMKFIDTYSQNLTNLVILQGVLRSGDPNAETLASQEVDAAATKFLVHQPNPTPGTQNNGPANAAQFQPFVTILQGLVSSQDSGLASQARQTLANLQNLLGNSNSNIAATP